jgi:drug/metabolite transporter (DMT)-like permease
MTKGILLILCAELFFTLSSVITKHVTLISPVPALEVSFFRFFFGFILTAAWFIRSHNSLKPNRWLTVVFRGVFNTTAVLLFFSSIQHTTVSNANILNLTYPAFVFLTAPFINREKGRPLMWLFLLMTLGGIWLVIRPDFGSVNIGDLTGLLSGIVSALAISTLKEAREYDSTQIILFYLMATGTIINGIAVIPTFRIPSGSAALWVLAGALTGVAGQWLLTEGYMFVSARTGSLFSGSRIIYAILFGALFFGERLSPPVLIGAFLILASIIGVSSLALKIPVKKRNP